MNSSLALNADLGESFGAWSMGSDAELLPVIQSANIACGYHAGDPLVMRRTVALAKEHGVSIGAHPAFPDLQGFGRRRMILDGETLQAMILYQIGALAGVARAEGMEVTHVKPHGALSNMACEDPHLAAQVVAAVKSFSAGMNLLAPALSPLANIGAEAGLRVVAEIFADRAYQEDGQLVPRGKPGAMVHGAAESLAHVEKMLQAGGLVALSGKVLPSEIGSICVHGDGPDAVATARHLKSALLAKGYVLAPLG